MNDVKPYAFFYTDTKRVGGEKVEYEILFGDERIVFIKVGAGTEVCAPASKYLRMAQSIHRRTGATVICASNPDVVHEAVDEEEIRSVAAKQNRSGFTVLFIGISDGAYHNLSLARRFRETVHLIGINTSYIDVPDLQERLRALQDVPKVLVYGTEDDDFDEVVPALGNMACDNLVLKIVEGADHRFSGMDAEFIALADDFVYR